MRPTVADLHAVAGDASQLPAIVDRYLASPEFGATMKDLYPLDQYRARNINDWKTTNKRPPLFFGQPAPGMDGLGQAIASDPRFAQCAAQHFAAYLTERAPADLPLAWVAALQQGFVASKFSAKALAKQVVLSDEFRVAGDSDPVIADTATDDVQAQTINLSTGAVDPNGITLLSQNFVAGVLKACGVDPSAHLGNTEVCDAFVA